MKHDLIQRPPVDLTIPLLGGLLILLYLLIF
jgi:hypothetical protein